MGGIKYWARRLEGRLAALLAKDVGANAGLGAEALQVLMRSYRAGGIRTVFDIGAHKGRWSRGMRRKMPAARFILFEANPLHVPDLAASGFEYHVSVLTGPGIKEIEFYSLNDDVGSTGGSTYREKTPQYRSIAPVRLAAKTLREVVADAKLPPADFVKMDAQGAELDIISGGEEVLARASFIQLEAPIIEYNKGAPHIEQYLGCLYDLGFLPVAISEIHRYGPILIQVDLLFIKRRQVDERFLRGLQIGA